MQRPPPPHSKTACKTPVELRRWGKCSFIFLLMAFLPAPAQGVFQRCSYLTLCSRPDSADGFLSPSRSSSRNGEKDWENGSTTSSVTSNTEYTGRTATRAVPSIIRRGVTLMRMVRGGSWRLDRSFLSSAVWHKQRGCRGNSHYGMLSFIPHQDRGCTRNRVPNLTSTSSRMLWLTAAWQEK